MQACLYTYEFTILFHKLNLEGSIRHTKGSHVRFFQIQPDLVIATNDTTEYSTSDEYFQGMDLFLSKLLPYNGNRT